MRNSNEEVAAGFPFKILLQEHTHPFVTGAEALAWLHDLAQRLG